MPGYPSQRPSSLRRLGPYALIRSASVGMIFSARNVGTMQASVPINSITPTPMASARSRGE